MFRNQSLDCALWSSVSQLTLETDGWLYIRYHKDILWLCARHISGGPSQYKSILLVQL